MNQSGSWKTLSPRIFEACTAMFSKEIAPMCSKNQGCSIWYRYLANVNKVRWSYRHRLRHSDIFEACALDIDLDPKSICDPRVPSLVALGTKWSRAVSVGLSLCNYT